MFEYKTGTDCIKWQQLSDLYKGIGGLVGDFGASGDRDSIKTAFVNSFKVVTAWDDSRLIGAARMVSDGICYGTIFDVAVLTEYRRRGVATNIMKVLLDGTENLSIHLTSAFGIEGLYKSLGFKRHKNAFAKYPHPSQYLED
jgi:predicted GNAT family acetyltransferase